MTSRRYLVGPLAAALWLLLAVLWLAYRIAAKAARRALPPILRWLIPRPSYRPFRYRRVLGWFPQRQRRPRLAGVPSGAEPKRMSSRQRAELVAVCADRDGLVCQECGARLDPTVHHLKDEHPELHHLVAWCRAKGLWWCDHPVNLVLLCGPDNRSIGNGTTPTLEAKRAALWRHYRIDQPGRAA